MIIPQDFTLLNGLNEFVNAEALLATMVISTLMVYATIEVVTTVANIIINVPGFGAEVVNHAINNPHVYLIDYTKFLMDNIIQNTVLLDLIDNPEKTMTLTDLKQEQEFEENSRMLHYIIVHGEVQRLLLAKLENNGTWRILMEATIGRETSVMEAAVIRRNFSVEMMSLCSTCSRVLDIKCSIIIKHTDDIMVMTDAFLPCLDVLSRYTWHLSAICYENPEIRTHISDVSNNTQQLFGFINYLNTQILQYNALVLSDINQNSADNIWIVMQQTSQLFRYMECVYRWYHPDYVTILNVTPTEYVEFN